MLDRRLAAIAAILLAVVGVQAWEILGTGNYGHQHEIWLMLGAVALACVPPVRRNFNRFWESLQNPSEKTRTWIAAALSVCAFAFLFGMQLYQHSQIRLFFHDEFSYELQVRMLAHGKLWMPSLPAPEFFDSFYIFVTPVYASMYFPGTAMLYFPVIWLHLPLFIGPMVACSISVGLVYLILSEILDGACGILGVIVLLSISMFRLMSIMLLSESPMLLLGLVMLFAYLRWRRKRNPLWILLLGIASGWAAITRPADALCFAIPIGIAMILDLIGKPRVTWLFTAVILIAGILPFAAIQLEFNHGVTGHWFQTPFSMYTDQNYPGGGWGFHTPPADSLHVSDVPEKQYFFETTALKTMRHHRIEDLLSLANFRLSQMTASALPDAFLWILIPSALLAVWNRRRFALWGALPLFVFMYAAYPWTIPFYATPIFPAIIFLLVAPIHWLGESFPEHRAGLRTAVAFCILVLCICTWPQFDRQTRDQNHHMGRLIAIDQQIADHVSAPAVVLFHFDPQKDNPEEEPVYNSGVTWPDDAPIIRAHDFNVDPADLGKSGDADSLLYRYFASVQPARVVYFYDERGSDPVITRLGTVEELWQRCNH